MYIIFPDESATVKNELPCIATSLLLPVCNNEPCLKSVVVPPTVIPPLAT
ncbi:MAG: hypothetical protein U0457_16830 [Candidatus Sericytochromatia bacterium]